MIALYVHVPFCHSICHYCAFAKTIWNAQSQVQYVKALACEHRAYASAFGRLKVSSLFIGGGTPNSLSPPYFKELLEGLHQSFDFTEAVEKTCEMNPESVTPAHVEILAAQGFNRVSLGVQSFDESEQKHLGRWSRTHHVIRAVNRLKQSGIVNINLDFMFGLSNQTMASLEKSLSQAIALEPTHLSTYALTIEPGTTFAKNKQTGLPEHQELVQYKFIQKFLKQHAYRQYEVSAFAKKGFESRHNLTYWHLDPFIGLGPSGASFFMQKTYTQTSDIAAYCDMPIPPILRKNIPPLSKDNQLKDYIVANLRRLDGIALDLFHKRFGHPIEFFFNTEIQTFLASGHLKQTKRALKVTSKGLYILDSLLLAFV